MRVDTHRDSSSASSRMRATRIILHSHAHRDRRRSRRLRAEAASRSASLQRLGHDVDDRGTHSDATVDYPPICADVAREVTLGPGRPRHRDRRQRPGRTDRREQGAGVRAALCNDLYTARMSREHNDANVLAIGGRIVALRLADEIVTLWLDHARSRADVTSAGSIRSRRSSARQRGFAIAASRSQVSEHDDERRDSNPLANAGGNRSGDCRRPSRMSGTGRTAASS